MNSVTESKNFSASLSNSWNQLNAGAQKAIQGTVKEGRTWSAYFKANPWIAESAKTVLFVGVGYGVSLVFPKEVVALESKYPGVATAIAAGLGLEKLTTFVSSFWASPEAEQQLASVASSVVTGVEQGLTAVKKSVIAE